MSSYDSSSGMKAFLLRHLGVGGMVYCWFGEALILTSGIQKEALILWASFCRFLTPGHHAGVPNCLACYSNHISTLETGGSLMWFLTFLPKLGSTTGSLKVTLLLGGGPSEDHGCLLWELFWGWLWLWVLLWLLLLLLEWLLLLLLLQVQEQVHDLFNLGHCSSSCSTPSVVVVGYPCLCIQSFREEWISQIVFFLCSFPQQGRHGGLCSRKTLW